MRKPLVVLLGVLISAQALAADGLEWGAFVDSYYAFDLQPSPSRDRPFTTQAVRHNEFNLNLVHLEAKVNQPQIRGRLALQAGTSVQSNYAGEPAIGANSGPSLVRHIQEGFAGVRVAPDLWVDAGIFFSHIGLESWISADNWSYTRSLVADYSPYYQAGVRGGWKANDRWSFQLLVLNGWQIVSENNDAKSLGTQVAYTPNSVWSLTYSTLLGKEKAFRQFHDLVLKFTPSAIYQAAGQVDVGRESSTWSGFTFIQRVRLQQALHLVVRAERYWDPEGAIVGLQTWGASLGFDYAVTPQALLRTEFRSLSAVDQAWTTSLALRL